MDDPDIQEGNVLGELGGEGTAEGEVLLKEPQPQLLKMTKKGKKIY